MDIDSHISSKSIYFNQYHNPECIRYFSMAMMKHHHQGNLYKKEFVLAYSLRGMTHGSHWQAWWQKQEVESSHTRLQTWNIESEQNDARLNVKAHSQWCISSSKVVASKPPQRASPTGNQVFKCPSLWEIFVIQTTTMRAEKAYWRQYDSAEV